MNNKAFTLIEILVVVLIIGILAAIAIVSYNNAVKNAEFAKTINISNDIAAAQERYFMANSTFTMNMDDLDIDLPAHTRKESAGMVILEFTGNKVVSQMEFYIETHNSRFLIRSSIKGKNNIPMYGAHTRPVLKKKGVFCFVDNTFPGSSIKSSIKVCNNFDLPIWCQYNNYHDCVNSSNLITP